YQPILAFYRRVLWRLVVPRFCGMGSLPSRSKWCLVDRYLHFLTPHSLVFVHGLRGDRIATWSRDQICWPRGLLKDDIPNVRIITWGYDSSVLRTTKSAS